MTNAHTMKTLAKLAPVPKQSVISLWLQECNKQQVSLKSQAYINEKMS